MIGVLICTKLPGLIEREATSLLAWARQDWACVVFNLHVQHGPAGVQTAAVAFRARLFNIGAEGQATLGGLGVALVCLSLPWPHWALALPAAMVGAALFGAAWAFIPAWLQAKRGSHVVITTIMFNFIAAALLNWLLVNVMRPAGSMDPATARFPAGTTLPMVVFSMLRLGLISAARCARSRASPRSGSPT